MPLSVPRSAGRDRKWHLDAKGGGRLSDHDVREPRRSGHSPACASPARSRRRRCPPRTCRRPANVSSGHRCAACSARWSAKPQPNSTSWMATTPFRNCTRPSAPRRRLRVRRRDTRGWRRGSRVRGVGEADAAAGVMSATTAITAMVVAMIHAPCCLSVMISSPWLESRALLAR